MRASVKDIPALIKFGALYPKAHRYVICRTPNRYVFDGITFLGIDEGINEVVSIAGSEDRIMD